MKKKVDDAPKPEKKFGLKKKAEKKSSEEKKTSTVVEFKQVVVGIVILCFALLLLVWSFEDIKKCCWLASDTETIEPYEPKNVIVLFSTTTTEKVDYQIYYTVERERWFDEAHMVSVAGKVGRNGYYVVLPTEKVYNIRVDFGENPGTVTIHDIHLMGTQVADLNDFDNYKFNQIEEFAINEDGSLTITSEERDPFIIYNRDLIK